MSASALPAVVEPPRQEVSLPGGPPRDGPPPGSRRIPAVLWDAHDEARRCLDAGRGEAAAVIAAAEAEAARLRRGAVVAGREEGLAAATEQLARAAAAADRLLREAEPALVDLAFAVASRVLSRIAERDRETVIEVAHRALEAVRRRAEVTLRAHPEDLAALREAEPALAAGLSRAPRVALVADAAVPRGGVTVETEAGTVDARLDAQLAALRRGLDLEAP